MFVWDFESLMILDCNEEALSLYGYTKEEFLQLNVVEIRPAEELKVFDELRKTILNLVKWFDLKLSI